MSDNEIKKDLNFLIVDDHIINLTLLGKILKRNGYKSIYTAKNFEDALRLIKKMPIDFIIADWHMPGKSGIDLLKTIRNDTKYQHIPFLMVTGEAEKEQVLHAVEEGVDGYQIKPYSEERIINRYYMPNRFLIQHSRRRGNNFLLA